jgi:rod shape-determining protein MreB and related proteins
VASVREMLSDIPPNLAEDVVRGKIRLAGGGALLPGLANRIEAATTIPVVVVDDPLRCVVRGAAEILEHSEGNSGAGTFWPRRQHDRVTGPSASPA